MIPLSEVLVRGAKLVSDNATTLLTASGVVGTVGTGVLSFRAGSRSRDKMVERETERDEAAARYAVESDGMGQFPQLTKLDRAKVILPDLVPPVILGAATIAAIVMSNRVSGKQAAALAAAYGLSQNQLEEYKGKVLQTLGVNKEQKIRDEIAQDRVNENPPTGQVLLLGEGEVLFYDSLSGRYFQSTVDRIRKAENAVNAQLFHHQICSLSFFYEEVGLPCTDLSDGIGWNMVTADHKQLEIKLSAVMTEGEKPCLAINFNNLPKHNYEQLY